MYVISLIQHYLQNIVLTEAFNLFLISRQVPIFLIIFCFRLYTTSKDSSKYAVLKSTPFKKVFENNVDEKETFAVTNTNTDVDKQIIKTLEGPNRAFFNSKARMLTKEKYKCKVIFPL